MAGAATESLAPTYLSVRTCRTRSVAGTLDEGRAHANQDKWHASLVQRNKEALLSGVEGEVVHELDPV
jgi:hypothetical protein